MQEQTYFEVILVMEEIKNALRNYSQNVDDRVRVLEFVNMIKQITNIADFVNTLSADQLNGKIPLFTYTDKQNYMTPVKLDMYWNSATKQLDLEWNYT